MSRNGAGYVKDLSHLCVKAVRKEIFRRKCKIWRRPL
jgi:hypothetical protein